jgi:hypothetical protein
MDGITILHSDRFRAGFYNLHDTDDGDIGFRLTDLSGGEHQIRSENISRVVRVRPSSMTRINKARLPVAGIIFFSVTIFITFCESDLDHPCFSTVFLQSDYSAFYTR